MNFSVFPEHTKMLISYLKMPLPLLYQQRSVLFIVKDKHVTPLRSFFQLPQPFQETFQLRHPACPTFTLSSSHTALFFIASMLSCFLSQSLCTCSLLLRNVPACTANHDHPQHRDPHHSSLHRSKTHLLQISIQPAKSSLTPQHYSPSQQPTPFLSCTYQSCTVEPRYDLIKVYFPTRLQAL